MRGALAAGAPAAAAAAAARAPRTARPTPPSRTASAAAPKTSARSSRPTWSLFRGLRAGRGPRLRPRRVPGDAERERAWPARGVEGNAHLASDAGPAGSTCRGATSLEFLRAQPDGFAGRRVRGAGGGAPPARGAAADLLREAHRALRPGGRLALETVNPRSVVGFLEVYIRDLTHERPLHPETLELPGRGRRLHGRPRRDARAGGSRRACCARSRPRACRRVAVQAMNENVERLNRLLYGPQEYVLLARR